MAPRGWALGQKDYVLRSGGHSHWRVAAVRNGVLENLGRFQDEHSAIEASESPGLPVLDRTLGCVHCGELNFDDYMVLDQVWRKAGVLAGRLHFRCLETRVGRDLTIEDFPLTPGNSTIRFGFNLGWKSSK